MRKYIVGNWKMNGLRSDLGVIGQIAALANTFSNVDSGLCIPSTLIAVATQQYPHFTIGGQDVHTATSGAHTGCISAAMLIDAGASVVIVGHSERRADQFESDALVQAKAQAAIAVGLSAIICVGETEAQRDNGDAENVVLGQIDGSIPDSATSDSVSIAYEPVWAIGTGRIPSVDDVTAMHSAIRARLVARLGDDGSKMQILYGGSMNGENAATLLAIPHVDGGLIGGASLSAEKFAPILAAAQDIGA